MSFTSVIISRHSHRSYKFQLLVLCGHFIPMRRRSCVRWTAFSLSASDPVRPPVPALHRNTSRSNALYKHNRSRSLTCCFRSQRDLVEWKAVTASIFSARHVLNVSEQGSKFLCRPPHGSRRGSGLSLNICF